MVRTFLPLCFNVGWMRFNTWTKKRRQRESTRKKEKGMCVCSIAVLEPFPCEAYRFGRHYRTYKICEANETQNKTDENQQTKTRNTLHVIDKIHCLQLKLGTVRWIHSLLTAPYVWNACILLCSSAYAWAHLRPNTLEMVLLFCHAALRYQLECIANSLTLKIYD